MVNQEFDDDSCPACLSVLGTLPGGFRASRERSLLSLLPCLIISLLRRINPKPEPRSAPAAADGDSASQCSNKCCRTASPPVYSFPILGNNAARDSSRFFPEECFAPS